MLLWCKEFCEYLGGAAEAPPPGLNFSLRSPWWGVWWAILIILILIFSGQTSKFIYIDF